MRERISNAQSVISQMREMDGNAVFDGWIEALSEALDYAEELETRLKSCVSCKYNFSETARCGECRAIDKGMYPLWTLKHL